MAVTKCIFQKSLNLLVFSSTNSLLSLARFFLHISNILRTAIFSENLILFSSSHHYRKIIQIQWLTTNILTEYRKTRTRNNSVFRHFWRGAYALIYYHHRGVFRHPLSNYDGALLRKLLTTKIRSLFSQNHSIIDIRLDSKYASASVLLSY